MMECCVVQSWSYNFIWSFMPANQLPFLEFKLTQSTRCRYYFLIRNGFWRRWKHPNARDFSTLFHRKIYFPSNQFRCKFLRVLKNVDVKTPMWSSSHNTQFNEDFQGRQDVLVLKTFSLSLEPLSQGLRQPLGSRVLTPFIAPAIRPRPTVSGFRQSARKSTGDFSPLLCPLSVEVRVDTWVRVKSGRNNLEFSSEQWWNNVKASRARTRFLSGPSVIIMFLRFGTWRERSPTAWLAGCCTSESERYRLALTLR